ncbi:neutral/alkaline non-lysosomal ceramidase N-terminal domain-containing protein [Streptomyces exfoliatus]|uniref:neutral/alkaline non-lysosomal ceramidase N-terminal domain-containing protein n=1 Tax=Streptomyces exfoliatus TaxID=1905 RepID=UPI003C2F93D3
MSVDPTPQDPGAAGYLVGRGISDITGEAAEIGLLGYAKSWQQSAGLHTRLRSRAFVIAHGEQRVLLVVSELATMFDSVHRAVLRTLRDRFGDLYTEQNTMLTVTHTHAAPAGYCHHWFWNGNTHGFRPKTFDAIVDGITESVERAHADLAPANLSLAHGTLHDASVNRSRVAWLRNPDADREFFPEAIDPQTSLLRIERDGALVGSVNWFATHGTSMSNENLLISADNKGYAAYQWERLVKGVDYLADEKPQFVGAFAQTNAGDMSPNLNLRPRSGPTEDEVENTRIIGLRQYEAAAALATGQGAPLTGGVDSRVTYVDMADIHVRPEFTPDGLPHRTAPPVAGASCLAGTDEGPGFPGFRQGRNPVLDTLSRQLPYRLSRRLRETQAPKAIAIPASLSRLTRMMQERFPVQLLRIGHLYLIGIPGEATITAGLRMRRAVAAAVGADLQDVLLAGYSNGFFHYVTTPEEYDAQRYEGGSTLFGRWQQPALTQVAVELADAMREGRSVPLGVLPPDRSGKQRPYVPTPTDAPPAGRAFGDVLVPPGDACRGGDTVKAVFVGAHPGNDPHRGGTFLEVQRREGEPWRTVADDGDWSTTLRWARVGKTGSRITVTWDVPADTPPGRYRLRYHGDARTESAGTPRPFTGTTPAFEVTA